MAHTHTVPRESEYFALATKVLGLKINSEIIGHRNYFKKVRMVVNEHDHTRTWKLLCEIARTCYTYLKK
jgi:hypothetical protein